MRIARMSCSFKFFLFWMSLVLCLQTVAAVQATAQDRRGHRRGGEAKAEIETKKEVEKKETEEAKDKKDDRYLLLRDGDVYPVVGPVQRATDILTKNGVILRLGRDLEGPEGCEILDVAGMRIYPGLVAVSTFGILGAEPPENSTDLYGLHMVLALSGGLTTVVGGNTAAKLTYGTTEDMVLKRNLFFSFKYSRRQMKKRQEMRNDMTRVRRYLRDLQAYEMEKARGVEGLTEPDKKWLKGKYDNYLKLMKGELIAKITASDAQSIRDACELARLFGFKLVVDGGSEAWILADEIGRADVELIITPRQKSNPDRRSVRQTGSNIQNARILYDHGVNFTILPRGRAINLSGISGRDVLTLPMEAAFAVRGGLPEEAAIEAITLGAARILGLDHRIGSIEVGKDADLIVCDGDLLHYSTMVQWTIVNGRIAYDKQKESLFAHIRPRGGKSGEVIEFWPRPLGEMPEYPDLMELLSEEKPEEPVGEESQPEPQPDSQDEVSSPDDP